MKTNLYRFMALCSLILLSMNGSSAQWVQTAMTDGEFVNSLAVSGSSLYAATATHGIFVSTTKGATWTAIDAGIPGYSPSTLISFQSYLFLGTYSYGALVSTDYGATWSTVKAGTWTGLVNAIAVSDTNLYLATSQGVRHASTTAAQWNPANVGLSTSYIYSLALSGTKLFAGGEGKAFISGDNSVTWSEISGGLPASIIQSMAVCGSTVIAGTNGNGIYITANNGESWSAANNGLGNLRINALLVSGTSIFAGTSGGVFLSRNMGASWEDCSSNLGYQMVTALAVLDNDLFIGTRYKSVWRRPLSEMLTSVGEAEKDMPTHFHLERNFPNPFNPSTTISFSIPSRSHVSLKIFDIMGREVSAIVSDELPAGNYSRQWNASGSPSGVYFYRLQAGAYTETKRMILTK